MIYLDSAATTLQKPPSVGRAVRWAVRNLSSPGRGGYDAAMSAAETAFECRMKAARLFNVKSPENIVFTSNATHGLNIALKSLVSPGGRVVISGYEHNAVTRPLNTMGAKVIVASSELFEPEMALFAFESRLTEDTSLVVCNHVSNVFGYILPVERIAKLCRERAIPFIVDASQSAGTLALDAQALGADFIAMPGHKGLYGPQGTGILICKADARTLIEGGTGSNSISSSMPDFLPDKLEAGTHNMPGIAGLAAGIDFVTKRGVKRILEHERRLIAFASSGLSMIGGVRVFRSEYPDFQTGVLSFICDGRSSESAGEELARRSIAVRSGLHCAPLAHRTADTLKTGTVRISVSAFNTKRDVSAFLNAMEDILNLDR